MSTTLDLNRLKDAVGFTATFRKWGNRRQGSMAKIETDADKSRLRLTKELVKADELDAIGTFLGELRRWIYINTVPSFFKEGFQLTGLNGIEPIEARMRKAQGELAGLVASLVAVYPAKIEEAKAGLNDQFNPRDYPAIESLPGLFSLGWNWISFTVPEGLPAELRAAEKDKLERQFADAGEQILSALRVGFQELVKHATERLTSEPGQKAKTFRDSVLGNIQEFIDTFNQRNLLNDVELAQLVSRAKDVLQGVTPQKLRDYALIKENTLKAFSEIQGTLDKMIVERPARKFDFESE